MQEDASGRHLLQPLAAGVPAALVVLAVVVVAVTEGGQELLREGAHGGHQGLAEDRVPAQLQLGIWRAGRGLAGLVLPTTSAGPRPQSPGPEPTPLTAGPPVCGRRAKTQTQPPKANFTHIDSPKARQFAEKLDSLDDPSAW